MEYETAGDPVSELKWTRKTTEKIAKKLAKINISIGRTTVGKILKKMKFSLKSNVKKISNGGKSVKKEEQLKRDQQFKFINRKRKEFSKRNLPVISVDTKKKEPIGNFKNQGRRYKRKADVTNDHDFVSYAQGKAAPYGIFDTNFNDGHVYVGQLLYDGKKFLSSDTPEFAVECIEKWWRNIGKKRYSDADEIFILADAGGSNGHKPHLWKVYLQEFLCNKHGLKVSVSHYPPGASKWNPIEHRLFSEITKNLLGTPLRTYETIIKYIRSTTTKTGLKVRAQLVTKKYQRGKKASKQDIENLNLRRHNTLKNWNYTIFPNI